MSTATIYLLGLLLCVVLFCEFASGVVLGTWWHPRITRESSPKAYWFVVACQVAILLAIVLTGKHWHVRQ